MDKVRLISRYILGTILVVFGLNGFHTFIPVPPMAIEAQQFMTALIETGYMLYLWKSIEVISGILLLTNRYICFALLIFLPVAVNIFCFHLFLDPKSIVVGSIVLGLTLFLLMPYQSTLQLLFKNNDH